MNKLHPICYTLLICIIIASVTLNYLTFKGYSVLPPDKRDEQALIIRDIFNQDADKKVKR